MMKLALQNFKSSFKNYLAVILSLAFTILVFLNFQNLIYTDVFDLLGEHNKEYVHILIQTVSFVLACFMFFFLWYATNVFLEKRKKEIGIYIFMGLTNQKIGKLYMIETVMNGVFALSLGVGFGILTTQLFQMILTAISEITVDISFRVSLKPVLITSGLYLVMYLIFAVKGYVEIVRSSVLELVSAMRQNEWVKDNYGLLLVKTVLGLGILAAGYYLAVKEGGQEVMGNVLAAVILVVTGVYLLFGGFFPLVFLKLVKRKAFLYQKERNLWMNRMVFRMKKNYRTYAMTCVLMICSVTALATGFALKERYKRIVRFEHNYTYQVLSSRADLSETIEGLLEKDNGIALCAELPVLSMDPSLFDGGRRESVCGVINYAQLKRLAIENNMEFDLPVPSDDEVIGLTNVYLLSLLTDRSGITVGIDGKRYRQIAETNEPYLGYFQEIMGFYIVSDAEYRRLLPKGEELYTYNYRTEDTSKFLESKEALSAIIGNTEENDTALAAVDPNSSDTDWIKVLYTICIFMFLVFVLASGSILFMKLYNDAFEEQGRNQVLKKLGVSYRTLRRSLSDELKAAYALPFFVMLISSWFSVHALEKMMYESLWTIYAASTGVIFAVYLCFYLVSVSICSESLKA